MPSQKVQRRNYRWQVVPERVYRPRLRTAFSLQQEPGQGPDAPNRWCRLEWAWSRIQPVQSLLEPLLPNLEVIVPGYPDPVRRAR